MTTQTINSWSYTRLSNFEACPYRAKLEYVDRIKDTAPKPAADRGTHIHQLAEDYVKGDIPVMPPELKKFEHEFLAMRRHFEQGRVSLEGEWGFDNEWRPTDWFKAWGRIKADGVVFLSKTHAAVIDYKGLAVDTPLPTPTGWTTIGDVSVGDKLFAQDGSVCTVTAKSRVKHLPCYKLSFDDTTKVICDNEHLWVLINGDVIPVSKLKVGDSIAVCKHIQLPEQNLPLDPYLLGLWLADGKHTSSEITKPDEFVWQEIQRLGYDVSHDYSTRAENNKCRTHTVLGIRSTLKQIGVLGNKHIPQIYMRASSSQRLALLQGLMDGDGSVNPLRKQVIFQSTDPDLSKQVLELILSLGQRAVRSECLTKGFGKLSVAYPISFRPNGLVPFRMPRKADACRNFGPGRSTHRRIKNIEQIEPVPTQCISVDSKNNTFLCTERFLPTHNTGKRFGNELKHGEQTQLYGLGAMIRYPELEQITTELWYLDKDELHDFKIRSTMTRKYLQIFDKRARKMTEATNFPPRPNIVSCKWCPYHRDRLAVCKFGI